MNICTGVYADATGAIAAAAAIQSCLNLTVSGSTFRLPVGTYLVDNQITLNRPVTFGTIPPVFSPSGNCENIPCATLLAAPTLHAPPPGGWPAPRAVLQVSSPNVKIDFLAIDGDRNSRLFSWAGSQCSVFNNSFGFNVLVLADNVSFTRNLSTRALCATALGWYGSSAIVTDSSFIANGNHYTRGVWADGITIGSDNAQILRNRILDSSDVGMVLMYGKNSLIKDNLIEQNTQPIFGGLVVFRQLGPGGVPLSDGDYTGTVVTQNTLECQKNCFVGLHVGARPWQSGESSRVFGVTVHGNTVHDSAFGVSASIAGTITSPVHIYNNTATGAFSIAFVNLCANTSPNGGSNYNIAPTGDTLGNPIDSVIDHHGDTTVYTQLPMCNP
ncbi:MAG TPA: right-handed parallel beta-helix repeat-containing protein [Dokdonella sp.]|uniref:right-handed parallel beta-helix repeat-containing protein n=1 Tax=Dokdonella sp. TaxID=2291710 RepID=UPI002BE27C2F|nr:right-handed parallel beta-helix repeat-containing protein [Dokdonella sp.]HUD43859.1 right-handed parallel beta-helix repeat-containing protein [Dokdonella sp.]